tara:strand:+ start:298 stop:804 length:507 start_codon:yes stop_codon:yes gene_type:complete
MEELFNAKGWTITKETSKPNPDGQVRTSIRANACDTVSIIAFNADNKILLLREYRPYWECYVWMLPSGKVDKEKDMNVAAMRELQEETGFKATDMQKYLSADSTERVKFVTHIYVAHDLVHDPLSQDHDELIEVHELDIEEAIDNVLSSPRVHMASAYALMRYQRENN